MFLEVEVCHLLLAEVLREYQLCLGNWIKEQGTKYVCFGQETSSVICICHE